MPTCKLCGQPITTAPVYHSECLKRANLVPVVRCGECIHRRSMNQRCIGRRPDWFCADGEPREDVEDDARKQLRKFVEDLLG